RVREQLTKRHVRNRVEFQKVLADLVVEAQLAVLLQHEHRCPEKLLTDRSDLVAVRTGRRALRVQPGVAESLRKCDPVIQDDGNGRTGYAQLLEFGSHDAPDTWLIEKRCEERHGTRDQRNRKDRERYSSHITTSAL